MSKRAHLTSCATLSSFDTSAMLDVPPNANSKELLPTLANVARVSPVLAPVLPQCFNSFCLSFSQPRVCLYKAIITSTSPCETPDSPLTNNKSNQRQGTGPSAGHTPVDLSPDTNQRVGSFGLIPRRVSEPLDRLSVSPL